MGREPMPAEAVLDLLVLLDEEHDLYLQLLDTAREQELLLEGADLTFSLAGLMRRREDLFLQIDAAEVACQSLLDEFSSPPDEVRAKAQEIGLTLEAILLQDTVNEQRLREGTLETPTAVFAH